MDLPVSNGYTWGSVTRGPRTEWSVTTPHDRPVAADKSPQTFSPDGDNLIKVVVLGAPGVGKTSVIQQFVWGTFETSYYPTSRKETYYPTVILHDRNYPLKIVDIPDLPFFPVSSVYNLSDLQAYGLRDANAYVLVYDLLCPDSFDYISGLFSQISESRSDLGTVPIIVIGNKTDKVHQNLRRKPTNRDGKRDDGSSSDSYSDFGYEDDHRFSAFHDFYYHPDHHTTGHRRYGGWGDSHFSSLGHRSHHKGSSKSSSKHKSKSSRSSSKHRSSSSRHRKSTRLTDSAFDTIHWRSEEYLESDIAEKVTGEWKVLYRECSARSTESVTDVFKTLMENVADAMIEIREQEGRRDDDHRRCVIL